MNFALATQYLPKVRGSPYWSAIFKTLDNTTYKTLIKYEVEFLGTKESAILYKCDICLYAENKQKYPVESVTLKCRDGFKWALLEFEQSWESTPVKSMKTPKQNNVKTKPSVLLLKNNESENKQNC